MLRSALLSILLFSFVSVSEAAWLDVGYGGFANTTVYDGAFSQNCATSPSMPFPIGGHCEASLPNANSVVDLSAYSNAYQGGLMMNVENEALGNASGVDIRAEHSISAVGMWWFGTSLSIPEPGSPFKANPFIFASSTGDVSTYCQLTIGSYLGGYHEKSYACDQQFELPFGEPLLISINIRFSANYDFTGPQKRGGSGTAYFDISNLTIEGRDGVFGPADAAPIPEPASFVLGGLGLAGLWLLRRSRR